MNNLNTLIASSTDKISQAYGFGFDSGVHWMQGQLFSILASFLGFFEQIFIYIVAIAVISSIIGLIYKGFIFFKH